MFGGVVLDIWGSSVGYLGEWSSGNRSFKEGAIFRKGGALQDLEQFLIEIFLLLAMIPVGLFLSPL